MPIQLVKKEERLVYKVSGSTFFYRRIPTGARSAIVRKHTKRGKTDWSAVMEEIIRYIMLGWEDVQLSGTDVPFDAELALSLPESILSELLELAGGSGEDEEGGAEKNLEISSSGS